MNRYQLIGLSVLILALFEGIALYWVGKPVKKTVYHLPPAPASLSQEGAKPILPPSVLTAVQPLSPTEPALVKESTFSIERIGPKMIFSGTPSAETLKNLASLTLLLERIGPESKLVLQDNTVTLVGIVPDEEAKKSLLAEALQRTPTAYQFKGLLTPVMKKPASLSKAKLSPEQRDLSEILAAIRLNFESGTAKLTPDTKFGFHLLKEALTHYKSARIRILGYSDSQGNIAYNYKLSERRALAIEQRLVQSGFSKKRFEIQARGLDFEIANNSTEKGRSLNRRVGFQVIR